MNSKNKGPIVSRQERKYSLGERDKQLLCAYLKIFMVEDPFMESKNGYFVSSLYFDSPEKMCLSQKINGDSSKLKFRMRCYENHETSFYLEVKKKKGVFSSKSRALCKTETSVLQKSPKDIAHFLNNLPATDANNSDFMYYYFKNRLQPMFWVHFNRFAYICPNGSGLRVTIDSSLSGQFVSASEISPTKKITFGKGFDILEIKATQVIPKWLEHFLNDSGIERISFSKYYECHLALQASRFHSSTDSFYSKGFPL